MRGKTPAPTTKRNITNILNEYYKSRDKIYGLELSSSYMTRESGLPIIEKVSMLFTSKLNAIKNALGITGKDIKSVRKADPNAFVRGINEYRKYINILSSLTYGQYTQLDVAVIVGVKTDLLTTTKILLKTFDAIHHDARTSLDNLDAFVSRVISNNDFRSSNKPIKADPVLSSLLSTLEKELERCMDHKKVKDRGHLKDLIPNFSVVPEIFNNIMTIANGYTIQDLQELSVIADAVYEKINVMVKQVSDMETNYSISKSVMAKLSTDIENGAKLITIIASYHHLFNQTVTVFKLMMDRLYMLKK